MRPRHVVHLSATRRFRLPKRPRFAAQGFEIGVHVTTGCSDYTPQSLEANYANEMAMFRSAFPWLPGADDEPDALRRLERLRHPAAGRAAHGIRARHELLLLARPHG